METEIFKTIEEFPNYMVSNFGNVRGNYSGIILKPYYNEKGYSMVTLCKPKQAQANRFIHRLVAKTFIENPNNYDQVNHIDGNKSNNCISNLEWCNYTQNKLHAVNVLNAFKFLKNKPIARKLTVEQVIKIKQIFTSSVVTTDLINSIASEHDVNPQTIRCIYWGKTWKDVE
jgi:hypothetical protein